MSWKYGVTWRKNPWKYSVTWRKNPWKYSVTLGGRYVTLFFKTESRSALPSSGKKCPLILGHFHCIDQYLPLADFGAWTSPSPQCTGGAP